MFNIRTRNSVLRSNLTENEAFDTLPVVQAMHPQALIERTVPTCFEHAAECPFFRISGDREEQVKNPWFQLESEHYQSMVHLITSRKDVNNLHLGMRHCPETLTYQAGLMFHIPINNTLFWPDRIKYMLNGQIHLDYVMCDLRLHFHQANILNTVFFGLKRYEDRAGYIDNSVAGFIPFNPMQISKDRLDEELTKSVKFLHTYKTV